MGTDAHTPKSRAGQAFEVVHHPDERFYELLVDGQFAGLIAHEDAGGRYVFTHTFIAEGFRGRGLSWALMRGALEDVKERHIAVTNYCWLSKTCDNQHYGDTAVMPTCMRDTREHRARR